MDRNRTARGLGRRGEGLEMRTVFQVRAARWWQGLLLAVAVTVGWVGCGPQADDPTLVVGMELAYPPFEMRDASGEPTGISVAIAKALGEHLERPVTIENLAFDGLIPALKTGKIDLIISSMTATEDRSKSIDFSEPYLSTGLCVLVSNESVAESIDSLEEDTRMIAVKNGTTGHQYAVNRWGTDRVLVLDSEASCVLEVVQGKASGFIYDQMSVYKNWQRHEETTKPLLDPFQRESWAVGVRKGRPELLGQVNQFLSDYRDAGGFAALGDEYLAEQKAAFAKLGIPFYF